MFLKQKEKVRYYVYDQSSILNKKKITKIFSAWLQRSKETRDTYDLQLSR